VIWSGGKGGRPGAAFVRSNYPPTEFDFESYKSMRFWKLNRQQKRNRARTSVRLETEKGGRKVLLKLALLLWRWCGCQEKHSRTLRTVSSMNGVRNGEEHLIAVVRLKDPTWS